MSSNILTMCSDHCSDDKREEAGKPDLREKSSQQKQAIIAFIATIAILVVIFVSVVASVVTVVIYNKLAEPAEVEHNHNITDLQSDPSHKEEVSDDDLRDRVLQLEEMLQNASARISNLEDRQYDGTISELRARVDQLERQTTALEANKASQKEVDELSISIAELNDFTTISNSTSKFLHLSGRVDDINDTTVKKEEFSDLAMKVTSLEGDIERIETTIATKADQQDVDENMNMITTLRETTVRREEFQGLETTVETLQTSKAEQSDLDDLQGTVTHLSQTAATKTELNSLSGRVQNHITSSQTEHNQLTSRISDNDRDIHSLQNRMTTVEGDIKGLKNRITNAEGDIEELKSAGSRPAASWLIITMAIITTFLYNVSLL